MTLGDRVAVLSDGELQQVDTPQALFRAPANLFVAGFIGSPAMNLVEARLAGDHLSFDRFRLPLPADADLGAYQGRSVILGIRPSDFEDADLRPDQRRATIEVTADVTEDHGTEVHVLFTVEAPPVEVEGVEEDPEAAGAPIPLVAAKGTSVFTAAVDAHTAARPGRRVRLSVNPARFHFFDPQSGLAVGRRAGAGARSGGDAAVAEGPAIAQR
jgi:multiple sugar transport system ATP-binding protein